MRDDRLSVKVSNDLSEIPRLAETIDTFCAGHGIPQKIVLDFHLALDEVLTNIISYAFRDAARHDIEVAMSYRDECLTIEIVDDGPAFDPLQAPPPDVTSALAERPVGGLGIHLVKKLMDGVDYRRQQDRNCLRLSKMVSKAGSAKS
jgi:serine/threonine-protein kinase RsbW